MKTKLRGGIGSLWVAIALAWTCHHLCLGQTDLPWKWHNRPLPALNSDPIWDCAYGNGTFVGISSVGISPASVYTSATGGQWTVNEGPGDPRLKTVEFGDGVFWAGGDYALYRSTNGIQWEKAWGSNYFAVHQGALAVAEGRVLAVGEGARILASPDLGVTWNSTQRLGNGYAAAIGNGLFVAAIASTKTVGNEIGEVTTLLVSTNGRDWATTDLALNWRVTNLLFVNGTFLAVVGTSTPSGHWSSYVMTSPDAVHWSSLVLVADDHYVWHAAYGNGWFMLCDTESSGWCSTNLVNWLPLDLNAVTNASRMCCCAYGAGTFVWGGWGALLQSDYLQVTPPSVGVPPRSTALYEGERAAFTLTAFGSPPLAYQWRHNGVPIDGATNVTLVIERVQSADAGSYDVVVTNAGGATTSQPALLQVSWVSISRFAGLRLTGQVGSPIRIECLESLADTNWLLLTNVALPTNPYIWIDYDSVAHPQRFYRAARP